MHSFADMLYLNKQRLIAIEELQKAERDKELLLAKVSQLEAEVQAATGEKDTLGQRLKTAEGSIALAESRAGKMLVISSNSFFVCMSFAGLFPGVMHGVGYNQL